MPFQNVLNCLKKQSFLSSRVYQGLKNRKISHIRPGVIANDVNGLEELASADVHLGGGPRLVGGLGPVGLLADEQLLVLGIARTQELLQGRS